jgi:hypothetical protein
MTDYTDLCRRLRDYYPPGDTMPPSCMDEAADALEALQKENEELREQNKWLKFDIDSLQTRLDFTDDAPTTAKGAPPAE